MSLDRSLKTKGSLERHRNILTRAERIARLEGETEWEEGSSVFGLPKTSNRKVKVVKAKKEVAKTAEEGEGTPTTEATPEEGQQT